MRYRSTNCDNCGAPLEVAYRSRRVQCRYCQSLTDASDLETLRWRLRNVSLQLDLDVLDRSWLVEREQLMARDSSGNYRLPSMSRVLWIGLPILAVCIVWTASFLIVESSAAVVGIMVATPVCVWMGVCWQQFERYRNARLLFDNQRAEVCTKLLELAAESPELAGLTNTEGRHDLSASRTTEPLLPEHSSVAAGRDVTRHEVALMDQKLEEMRLEAELKRVELAHQHYLVQAERRRVDLSELSNFTTHSTAVSPWLSICAAVLFIARLGPFGLIASVAFAVSAFLVEVRLKQWHLASEMRSRQQDFEQSKYRLEAKLEVHRQAV